MNEGNAITVLDLWGQFHAPAYSGGTIHQALAEFAKLPLREQDRFCGRLADACHALVDPEHAVMFQRARFAGLGVTATGTLTKEER